MKMEYDALWLMLESSRAGVRKRNAVDKIEFVSRSTWAVRPQPPAPTTHADARERDATTTSSSAASPRSQRHQALCE